MLHHRTPCVYFCQKKIHSFILSLDPLDEQMFKLLVLIMRATVGGSNQDLHRSD